MEKWEQELIKQVNTPLPEHVDQRIHLTLNHLKQNHKKPTKLRYIAAAAAASLAISLGLSAVNPNFAEAMRSLPLIGSVFELVGHDGLKRGSQLRLAAEIGQEVQIGEQRVTLTESLYDGSSIHLGLVIHPPIDENEPTSIVNDIVFTIDHKRPSNLGYGFSMEKLKDGTFAGTLSIDVEERLPDQFLLSLLSSDETKTYAEIPIERQGGYQSFTIDETRVWNAIEVNYESITLFPTSTQLALLFRNTSSPFWEIQVSDDRGRRLRPTGGRGSSHKESGSYTYSFEPLETIPKQLTIKPYFSSIDTSNKTRAVWKGVPVTLSQGMAGSVTVLDQELVNNSLTITYEIAGEGVFEQARHIWLEDSKDIPIHSDRPPIRIQGTDSYQLTFSNISNTDSISICTPQINIHYLQDLEVTVDLKS
ncbi:DUF4179 domain-containing protein [Paenibacillus nanensis]|nr:DUF4179 domain-containing protein [Paenibacillus nanensis]